jgi:DNA-binding CsgD family transcriptional regulator
VPGYEKFGVVALGRQTYISRMNTGLAALTDKEKQTLRLLINGYDAKSMALHLGLSVHTVNERLRDARRKLSTSSSRAAARLLREAETTHPELLGDELLGEAPVAISTHEPFQQPERTGRSRRTGWIAGGFVMSLALALAALASFTGSGETAAPASAVTPSSEERAAVDFARQWLTLVDAGNWAGAYAATGSTFRQHNSLQQWSSAAKGAHGAMGPALSRELVRSDYSPAPTTGVWTVRFRTRFANQREAVETLALSYESGSWRVVGLMLD